MLNRNIKGVAKIAKQYPGNCFLSILSDDPAALAAAVAQILNGVDAVMKMENELIEAAVQANIVRRFRTEFIDKLLQDALEAAAVLVESSEYMMRTREKASPKDEAAK